ncbi:hypothetical protein BS17DRAFT_816821 [Gyrodon lividus]|nr:hypothetical protein BS17DRAFT_816821 [Gyrodon lividus]
MPIGTINPHQALPPDYNNAHFQAARQPLNALDKEEWDQHQAAELKATQQQEDQRQHEAEE